MQNTKESHTNTLKWKVEKKEEIKNIHINTFTFAMWLRFSQWNDAPFLPFLLKLIG